MTPAELAGVLRTALEDSRSFSYVLIFWKDGHSATIKNAEDIEPIEDPSTISSISGKLFYEDDSNLTLSLRPYEDSTLSARGAMARDKSSLIAHQWAAIPGRGRLGYQQAFWAWNLSQSLVVGSLIALLQGLFFADSRNSPTQWSIRVGLMVFATCLYLGVRSTPSVRSLRKLVVLSRSPSSRTEFWTVISALAAVVGVLWTVIWGLIIYLHPAR